MSFVRILGGGFFFCKKGVKMVLANHTAAGTNIWGTLSWALEFKCPPFFSPFFFFEGEDMAMVVY